MLAIVPWYPYGMRWIILSIQICTSFILVPIAWWYCKLNIQAYYTQVYYHHQFNQLLLLLDIVPKEKRNCSGWKCIKLLFLNKNGVNILVQSLVIYLNRSTKYPPNSIPTSILYIFGGHVLVYFLDLAVCSCCGSCANVGDNLLKKTLI
jgi:hypothetical protein